MADKQSATPSSNPHLAALPEADTAEASTPSVTPSVPVQKEEDSDSTQETNDLKDDAPSTTEAQQIEDAQQIEELAAAIEALHVEHLPPVPLPEYPDAHPDLLRIARLIQGGKCKRIICMCGAGISVSAGIPDFRTPGTGLYSQLEKYKLPAPEAVFEINFFKRNPHPFYMLAKELWPGNYNPTPTHYFMRLLHEKELLLRCYTQNIDSLEAQAGLPITAVVAAHGNFDGAHCVRCRKQHDVERVKQAALEGVPLECGGKCKGIVKPEIVFFGEALPERFHTHVPLDFSCADLLLVMGTSLVVNPFATLIHLVADNVPRLLINREHVGVGAPGSGRGFDFVSKDSRDGVFLGNCDDGVEQLVRLLGWEEEFRSMVNKGPVNKL